MHFFATRLALRCIRMYISLTNNPRRVIYYPFVPRTFSRSFSFSRAPRREPGAGQDRIAAIAGRETGGGIPMHARITKGRRAGVHTCCGANVIACSLKPQEEFADPIIMSHTRGGKSRGVARNAGDFVTGYVSTLLIESRC